MAYNKAASEIMAVAKIPTLDMYVCKRLGVFFEKTLTFLNVC